MIRDIRRYLVNREDGYKTNQQYLGKKVLFQGYPIIVWFGTDFQMSKYQECNKTLVKICINFYKKYWRHRNKIMHNEIKQKDRIKQ